MCGESGQFFLNGDGGRAMQAGVPPDYFSEDGQLWGNPLYRWDRMKDDGFTWWIARLKNELIKFDAVRLDHFIAFSRYWEVPMDAETAKEGRYINVPGHEFFEAVQHSLGRLPFVAEDLGLVTEEVEHLRDRFELPGMKVMHFGFATGAHSHLPHCHPHNSIAYLGTHDNDTTRGWLDERRLASERGKPELDAELGRIQDYVGGRPGASLERKCIASLLSSGANVAILTPQDLLEEGTEHRMNVPGQAAGNWEYRLPIGALNKQLAREVRPLLEESGRVVQALERTA